MAGIRKADMDALLRFLPLFESPPRPFILRWDGGGMTAEGAMTMHHPVYAPEVEAFFLQAGQRCWADYGYEPRQAHAMLQDDAVIAQATLAQIKTMLTYCVRGERFVDGHWAAMLESGRVVALLRRLSELRDTVR